MSARKHRPSRSPWPVLIAMLAGAGLLLFLFERSPEADAPAPEILAASNAPDVAVTQTNQPSPPLDDEERVVNLVTEGNELLGQGKADLAEERFAQALAISPDQEDLHYNLAIALARQGKTDEAKERYREALEIYPDYAEAHNNLGNLLLNENKLDEAVEHFQQAVNNLPESAAFHNNLGTALGRQGKTSEAMAQFEEAISLNPNHVEARVNLATAYLSSGQVEEAIVQLNEALRLQPDFKPALHVLQRARQQQASTR